MMNINIPALICFFCFSCFSASALAQLEQIRVVGRFAGAGVVESIQPGEITIRREDGKEKSFLIQDKDERFLSLDGDELIVSLPSEIDVYGTLPIRLLEPGMVVKFQGEINRAGKTGKAVSELQVIEGDSSTIALAPARTPTGKEMVPCDFIGIVQRVSGNKVRLTVPKTKLTPKSRITVEISDDAFFDIRLDDLTRVQQGDQVVSFRGDTLRNGKMVIRDIHVELSPERTATTLSYNDRLYQKYSIYSDQTVAPREERSDHFVIYTDISPRSAKVLLEKLETMYGFLIGYYGARPHSAIECYVVNDYRKFVDDIPTFGIDKIRAKAGVTGFRRISSRGRRATHAIVYCCDDQDVVQHEAVHAFCSMTFGDVGPVWYAEGMAEMGQYFIPGEKSLQIEPVVIEYLKGAKLKDINTIINAQQITGDSWKAYAWRWAMCQLLTNHPSYSKPFRQLGQNLMLGNQDSFNSKFRDQIDRINFEYEQFLQHLDNGYRPDLCRWQWKDKARKLGKKNSLVKVAAQAGWQASNLLLDQQNTYDFVCPKLKSTKDSNDRVVQTWVIDGTRKPVAADGNARGDGKLIGAILDGFELSEPFEIGSRLNRFRPPASGQLYLRCREKMSDIADNQGEMKMYIRRSHSQTP